MAGLIEQAAGQQPAPQEQQPAQGQPVDQKAVERVVAAATRIIHDPQVKPQLLELMKNAGDPVNALVEAVFLIMVCSYMSVWTSHIHPRHKQSSLRRL